MQRSCRRSAMTTLGLVCTFVLAACVAAPAPTDRSASTATPSATATPVADERPPSVADVLFVRAAQSEDGTWAFTVTVQHPDTGWDNYADGWDVVTSDGVVLCPNPGCTFTRRLEHPHVEEQPFTRSQSGIVIPEDVVRVRVRAHSLVGGFGGREVEVDLTLGTGADYEVVPAATSGATSYGITHQRIDGNRLVAGKGNLSDALPLDVPLDGMPAWVVAAPIAGGSIWVVALTTGKIQAFRLQERTATPIDIEPSQMPPGAPPLLVVENGKPRLLTTPPDASMLTHPVPLERLDRLAYVAENGDVVLWDETSHRIGLRNLDMALAGDFDGDGNIELLLPDDAMRSIGAIRRTTGGAEVVRTLPMGGARVATNLAVVLDRNATTVGVGREDGVLRIWTP
jgi:hypothetical protein